MVRTSPGSITLLVFSALLCAAGRGWAQDADPEASGPLLLAQSAVRGRLSPVTRSALPWKKRHKRRKFSNGPRWVPRPRGASLERATELALGTHEAAIKLLRNRPDGRVVEAAGKEMPKTLLWPVVGGKWGRGFGYTRKARPDLHHNGVDIGAPEGAAVRACAAGIVAYSDNTLRGYGNAVLIVHPNGWVTLYAHNLRNTVQAGWRVKRGERIALLGQTGLAWGPHLHFEFRDNGRLRDPARLFRGNKSDELNGPLIELSPPLEDAFAAEAGGHPAAAAESRRQEPPVSRKDRNERNGAAPVRSGEGETRPPLDIGTRNAALRLMQKAPEQWELGQIEGRIFSTLLWPVRGGRLTRAFHPVRHRGIDIEAERGAPVRAAADGLVVYSGDELKGYGNAIILLHPNGWVTVYGSNQQNAVEAGDEVKRGNWIASVGTVGPRDRPHLHFEVLEDGERRDPVELLVNVPPDALVQNSKR
jgi:murein DD-endopeptidase MepM/ murein hydrolase activator NlpD